MIRHPAVKFRRKIYVKGPYHADAIDLAFSGMTESVRWRVYDRICDGKEDIVFGFATEDGQDWVDSTMQEARKAMYGFKD